ncbi:MAG: FKBP-type peptidyl-prolyl cis-trans isomerase [Planctomycetota bacterium]
MRAAVLWLSLALSACGSDSDPGSSPAPAPAQVPRTVDKGEGCTVEITVDGGGPVAHFGDEVSLTCDSRVKGAEMMKIASTEGWDTPLRVRIGDPSVLPGLSRGIDGLSVGSKARIEVPPSLAYGATGSPAAGIPPDATLVFDVEILGVRP